MSVDRELLEKMALLACSPELYYDLADNIDITTDDELNAIIQAKGNHNKELNIIANRL